VIKLLPETEGSLIAVQISGRLTAEDYEQAWIPRLNDAVEQHGKIRIVVYIDETFDGWDAAALWEDTKFGLTHIREIDKMALVGGPEWIGKLTDLFGSLVPGSYKSFEVGELEDAYAWVK
jgi:hypothetical protein